MLGFLLFEIFQKSKITKYCILYRGETQRGVSLPPHYDFFYTEFGIILGITSYWGHHSVCNCYDIEIIAEIWGSDDGKWVN